MHDWRGGRRTFGQIIEAITRSEVFTARAGDVMTTADREAFMDWFVQQRFAKTDAAELRNDWTNQLKHGRLTRADLIAARLARRAYGKQVSERCVWRRWHLD